MTEPQLPRTKYLAWLAENYGEIAAKIAESARWWGTAIEDIPRARLILDISGEVSDDREIESLVKFYGGEQWPEDILYARLGKPAFDGMPAIPARPCLVVNRLPDLVAASLAKDGFNDLNPFELLRLKVLITRQNRDAQMLYNYLLSSLVVILEDANR